MKRIGVVGNRRYPGLPAILGELAAAAPALGLSLHLEDELQPELEGAHGLSPSGDLDALLTLGGDGTMLRGARLLDGRPVPILGVNLGRLGFLTTCGREDMHLAVQRLAAGDFRIEPRMTLEASTSRGAAGDRMRALNDVVLHKGGFARVTLMRVTVNGDLIGRYAADGIIIATPTGSTAYNLSAGGPVVVPAVESIVITAISPHTLAVRPVVVPGDAQVALQAEDGPDELLVTVDGQVGTTFVPGDTLLVSRSPQPVLLVRFSEMTFFMRMRRKLGWGGLPERDEIDRC